MCKVVHQSCDPELSNDSSLPTNSFLVKYLVDENETYDIVVCSNMTKVFDFYWDNYRENLKTISLTKGRVNPRVWGSKKPKSESKKK